MITQTMVVLQYWSCDPKIRGIEVRSGKKWRAVNVMVWSGTAWARWEKAVEQKV